MATDEPPPTAPIASLLRFDEGSGPRVLLVGGTAAQRAQRLEEALAEAQSRCVVVRLDASLAERVARGEALSLADEVHAAAESALEKLRAPGGLYDNPCDGALPWLSGWLFRARSARREGVLLVLEGLDRWLDARGEGPRARRAAAARELLQTALEASKTRSLGVLAVVQAADARGGAALPGSLTERFEHTVHLGAPSVVTRDPLALVSRLAGRSFTLAALRESLAGWLELGAHGDDTVVLFEAPLGPPVLESPAPPEPSAPERSADVTALSHALRATTELREALRALDSEAPRTAPQWERAVRLGRARVPSALRALEAVPGERERALRQRAEQQCARFDERFRAWHREAWLGWQAGSRRPLTLAELPERLEASARAAHARHRQLVLLSGLRLDVAERLWASLQRAAPALSLREQGAHWAASPATREGQRSLLARGPGAAPEEGEPPPARSWEQALTPRREHVGSLEVLRVDALPWLLAQGEAPSRALARFEEALPSVLAELAARKPGGGVLCLAGDLGAELGEGAGGPLSVVVPWALWGWT